MDCEIHTKHTAIFCEIVEAVFAKIYGIKKEQERLYRVGK